MCKGDGDVVVHLLCVPEKKSFGPYFIVWGALGCLALFRMLHEESTRFIGGWDLIYLTCPTLHCRAWRKEHKNFNNG